MRLGAIAFFAGVLILHTLAELPSPWWGLVLPGMVAIIIYIPYLRLLAWLGAGFLWSLIWVGCAPQLQFRTEWESVDLQVKGWIASIPETLYRSSRFHFQVDTLRYGDVTHFPHPLDNLGMEVSWMAPNCS